MVSGPAFPERPAVGARGAGDRGRAVLFPRPAVLADRYDRRGLAVDDGGVAALGMSVGDIIKMQAFLVAPEGEAVDFDGFMKGYSQSFGTEEQPNLPVRSAMVVDALANPGWLVELEVTAVRP